MFNDTIIVGTTPVTYTRRAPRGNREVFVPSGDIPASERRLELGHEVTAAKRVNSLVKVAKNIPDPVTNVIGEASIQVKLVHQAHVSEAEMQLLADHMATFFSDAANVTKIFNQEQ